MLSSKARLNSHGQDSCYFLGLQEYDNNPYDAVLNPTGTIQMGLAENQVSIDRVESWLAKNPHAASYEQDGASTFRELALFQDYHGLPACKNVLVELMAELRGNKATFDPNKMVLTAGATSANEILMFCLAEPGDAFLIPTPYYPGFDRDLKWRTEAEIVPINCSSSKNFRVTESALEEAHKKALTLNLRVKGVFIVNPSNPLGTTMSRQELDLIINFSLANQIHIVSDEIYSGTTFSSPRFISILEVVMDRNLDSTELWNRIHIVYSLSKDFGLPGFRVGMIYSNNETLVSAATKMSSYALVSSQTQHLVSIILSDKKFTRAYIKENQKRLRKRQKMLVSGLTGSGIKCLKSNAGLFCWADMRHLMSSDTFEGEFDLWQKITREARLNISPGSAFHCTEPGWFRVCFANTSEEMLQLSMQRIRAFVCSIYEGRIIQKPMPWSCISRTRALTKWVFRLLSRAFKKIPN